MQLYFVNCLVGFFVVVATFPTTSAHVSSFLFNKFAEQTEMDDFAALDKLELKEPPMELTLNIPEDDEKSQINKKTHFVNKYLNVELKERLDRHRHSLENVEIQEGESYELNCIVDTRSQATAHWLRGENPEAQIKELMEQSVAGDLPKVDQNTISRIHLKYVIDCASKKDEGPIHCVGLSGEKQAYQSTKIIVKENNQSTQMCNSIVKPVITYNIDTLLSTIGSTIVLACEAKGFPQPITRWFDNHGASVANHSHNNRFTVLKNGQLIIRNLLWDDMGSFQCTAESTKGTDTTETFVYPMKP